MRWRRAWQQQRLQEEARQGWQMQKIWFSGFACAGSVAGALTYGVRMGNLIQIYTTIKLESQLLPAKNASSAALMVIEREYVLRNRFAAAYFVLYPWEVAFVELAKLLVLKRMHDFAAVKSQMSRTWKIRSRLFLAVLVICNVIGFCGNVVSAVLFNQSADFSEAAVGAFLVDDTALGESFVLKARTKALNAGANLAVQRFSEAAFLSTLLVAFFFVGLRSYRVIGAAMQTIFRASKIAEWRRRSSTAAASVIVTQLAAQDLFAQASAQGKRLQRKVVATFIFVFVGVLLRSVFDMLFAIVSALGNGGNPCGPTCHPCRGTFSHIHDWILYTPSVQQAVTLIASPSTVLVALWGMSDVNELETNQKSIPKASENLHMRLPETQQQRT